MISVRTANDFDVRAARYNRSVEFLQAEQLKRKVKSNKGQVALGGRGRRVGSVSPALSPKKTFGCHKTNKEKPPERGWELQV